MLWFIWLYGVVVIVVVVGVSANIKPLIFFCLTDDRKVKKRRERKVESVQRLTSAEMRKERGEI